MTVNDVTSTNSGASRCTSRVHENRGDASAAHHKGAPCTVKTPIAFLNPESKNYERDLKFAQLLFRGAMVYYAAGQCQMQPNHGYLLLSRWRKKAVDKAGRAVNDTLILRTIVEPEAAQEDWKTILTTHYQKVAKTGDHAKK